MFLVFSNIEIKCTIIINNYNDIFDATEIANK